MKTATEEVKIIELEISEDSGSVRIDKYLANCLPDYSRGEIQKWLNGGLIERSGEVLTKKMELHEGDLLRISLKDEDTNILKPNPIPLDILYEDEWLMVINKKAGMVVHPGSNTENDTLVHALIAHCGDDIRSVGEEDRPGIVHRLDKDTSGLIIVGKTSESHALLQAQFSNREVFKEYECIVCGDPKEDSGTIDEPISRHPATRVKMAVVEGGKEAKTDWEVVKRFGQYTHMRCRIHTGRTHQIRVHMHFIGHIIVGDKIYGYKPRRLQEMNIPRVLLHSRKISFTHPETKEVLTFSAPTPEDFNSLLG